ncbi:DUF2269 domain-containing protein [Planktotalea sp.]|uniref:DUF2269 family protein n=1 Tax=Planktotalea sp. TaxID=2029877 RepID=UPI00329871CB
MEWIDLIRWLHVLGACVLLGTGAGIAFFMLMAHRSGDTKFIMQTANTVIVADTLFTASAAIIQPITGFMLARALGWDLGEGWVALSLLLYVVTGVFWLPVVWIQIQLRDLARVAVQADATLSKRYHTLFRIWFACGFPAFFCVMSIVWLMLMRPDLGTWF